MAAVPPVRAGSQKAPALPAHAATRHSNGHQQAMSLAVAEARAAGPRQKTGAFSKRSPRGGATGCRYVGPTNGPIRTGGANPRYPDSGFDNDVVTIRLHTSWSLMAIFLMLAILFGMNVPRASPFTAYDYSNRSNNVEAFNNEGTIELAGRTFKAVIGETTSHQDFLAGGLNEAGNCEVGTHRVWISDSPVHH